MKNVIITGGSGYIGSTISYLLLKEGYRVINIDINKPKFTDDNYIWINKAIDDQSLKSAYPEIQFIGRGDQFLGLIHMAAWKDLPGSLKNPIEYYRNNIISTITALELANSLKCKNFIFSSTAGVYSSELAGAVKETHPTVPDSPYGSSKLMCEKIINDSCTQYGMNSYNLRYQNPIGTLEGVSVDTSDSMFGNILNHLNDGKFTIFGGDYDTPDGTPIRDYIDLRDIARAHIYFLEFTETAYHKTSCVTPIHDTVNIGTGMGTSCLQVCDLVKTLVPTFKYTIGPKREGDAPGSYADTTKLNKVYGFECKYHILDSIENLLKFVKNN